MQDSRLQDNLPNLIGKLFRVMARVHNRAVRPFEISAVQAHVLAVLWVRGPLTVGELQATLMLGSGTLTGALDRMEEARLVKRVPVEGDRRSYRLEPAAWPPKKRDALLERLAETDELCFRRLSASERRQLTQLLRKALTSIEDVDDEE